MKPLVAALRGGPPTSLDENWPGWSDLHSFYDEVADPEQPPVQEPSAAPGSMETFFNRAAEQGLLDLSDRVSVHMATIGGAGFERALEAVRSQDVRVKVTVIRHAAPISAAYQAMLDQCDADYYVQVDEDVEMDRDAVRRLFVAIDEGPKNVAVHGRNLFDTHANRPIRALKIHRRSITANYPYRNVRGCDRDQRERMAADGHLTDFQAPDDPDIVGRHGIVWTPWSLYERYFTLWQKIRAGSSTVPWVRQTGLDMLDLHMTSANERTFFPPTGILAAAATKQPAVRAEKDFRRYREKTPGWSRLTNLFEQAKGG